MCTCTPRSAALRILVGMSEQDISEDTPDRASIIIVSDFV
jgi:hypothetical protein